MRVLLDTHTFMWLATDDPELPTRTSELIETAEAQTLSVASIWEGEIKRAAGRLDAPPFAEAARSVGIELLDITAAHATAAAALPRLHGDPFDRLLVAQAQLEGLVLVTKDEAIRRYGVPTAW